ncbi:hypothetical protein D3C87_32960 [compost metagenome]
MKRTLFYALSVAFLTAGLVSCAKTTKGKMANEWKVTSQNETSTSVQADGNKTEETTTYSATTLSKTTVYTPVIGPQMTSVQTGIINTNDLKIEKDGTWTWTKTILYGSGNSTELSTDIQSGTWSFIGKTEGDEFKKNERVLFNILSVKNTTIETDQGSATTTTSSDTYLTGESTMIFTIKESKKDELQMEAEGKNVYTDDSDISTYTSKISVTLSEK